MGISASDRKLLWGRSGGFCAKCKTLLTAERTQVDPPAVLGEEAHIVSAKAGGPRHRPMPAEPVDGYGNLILLCPKDHTLIDKQPKAFPEEMLRSMKRDHEEWVRQRGAQVPQLRIRDLHPKEPLYLRKMDRGTDLLDAFAQCLASSTGHPDPISEGEADLLADFLGNLHDWSEIWGEVEPGDRVKAKFQMGERLDELRQAGFVVYVGVREKVLEGGIGGPIAWPEAVLSIHRSDDPLVAAGASAPTDSGPDAHSAKSA
jgi:hypothetical protein